jgi:hypothetical protein
MTIPAPPACLSRTYSANQNQKGGTLIAENILSRREHRRLLANPDSYRPLTCLKCGHFRLHAHDFRYRRLRGDPDSIVERVRRYRCVFCLAVWMVLPGFLARHLHRSWEIVQAALAACGILEREESHQRVQVPATTWRRWARRLRSSAKLLVQALAGAGAAFAATLGRLSVVCSRSELVEQLVREDLLRSDCRLAQFAGWIHRAAPGVRLV